MLFEGMPWPLVLPLGAVAMIYATTLCKSEEKEYQKELDKIRKNEK